MLYKLLTGDLILLNCSYISWVSWGAANVTFETIFKNQQLLIRFVATHINQGNNLQSCVSKILTGLVIKR